MKKRRFINFKVNDDMNVEIIFHRFELNNITQVITTHTAHAWNTLERHHRHLYTLKTSYRYATPVKAVVHKQWLPIKAHIRHIYYHHASTNAVRYKSTPDTRTSHVPIKPIYIYERLTKQSRKKCNPSNLAAHKAHNLDYEH